LTVVGQPANFAESRSSKHRCYRSTFRHPSWPAEPVGRLQTQEAVTDFELWIE
jgi:hypothetical protein